MRNCQLQTLPCRRTRIDKCRANVVHYMGTGKRPLRFPTEYPIRGHGGRGRLGGFRFHCESVQVRVLLPAPRSHPDFDRVRVGFFLHIFHIFPVIPKFSEQINRKCFFVPQKSFKQIVFAERFPFSPFN